MTGAWHVYRRGRARGALARGAPGSTLRANGLVAVQFGGPVLELLDRARVALHPALRSLGPDLLDDDPQIAVAVERARARAHATRPIGEVLLDQTVAAGIGNVVRCEALYALRIDPWAPLGGIVRRHADRRSSSSARRMLQAGVRDGGRLPKAVYGARRCRRCGGAVSRRGQGDEARIGALVPGLPDSLQIVQCDRFVLQRESTLTISRLLPIREPERAPNSPPWGVAAP